MTEIRPTLTQDETIVDVMRLAMTSASGGRERAITVSDPRYAAGLALEALRAAGYDVVRRVDAAETTAWISASEDTASSRERPEGGRDGAAQPRDGSRGERDARLTADAVVDVVLEALGREEPSPEPRAPLLSRPEAATMTSPELDRAARRVLTRVIQQELLDQHPVDLAMQLLDALAANGIVLTCACRRVVSLDRLELDERGEDVTHRCAHGRVLS